ncbi:hypothetical protein KSP40_PGU001345 [Platanthera guangdongensis]|uniref:Sucrase n=1 Tax=Platanthera guangdongensis TaxID=2320717 RepID=A0ABR2N0U0_9ASPA
MEYAPRSSPISFSGVLSTGDDGFLPADQGSQIGNAGGSLQGEGILSSGGDVAGNSDTEFGFQRPELGKEPLAGTVQFYERHVFLCYKTPHVWLSHVEAAEFDRLPRLFSAALGARIGEMMKRTRLTICEGEDGTETSNGDVLIFPDMIRYRRLTHFDVDHFVEEVLVKDGQWLLGAVENLKGSFVFVCSHGSRDPRCGVCEPVLIKKFKEEINLRDLHGQVSVSPCSHIGGHEYAGNVIIFSSSINGEVTGQWYGNVTPDDIPLLLEQHIGKGEILDHLWRGQMGLSEEEQRRAQELRVQVNAETEELNSKSPKLESEAGIENDISIPEDSCQGIASSSCCQNGAVNGKSENLCANLEVRGSQARLPCKRNSLNKSSCSIRKVSALPSWFECWELEDSYAALAVVAAIASVAVAYSCYQQLR